jgi:tetratricopeptide (TPR) repeat protein
VVQDVQVLVTVLDTQVRQVNSLNAEKRYEEALKQVRAAGETVRPLSAEAQKGLAELRREAKDVDMENNSMLTWLGEELAEVRTRAGTLDTLAGDLNKTIDDINAQNLAKVSVGQAGQSEAAGDFDQAIALYEQALRQWPDQPDTKRHYEELKEAWRAKDDEHTASRQFLRDRWAKADVKEIGDLLAQARQHFEVLKRHDDKLAARLLLKRNGDHLRNLSELVDMLSSRSENKDAFETYSKLTEDVAKFQLEVSELLKGGPVRQTPETPEAAGAGKEEEKE